MTISSDVFRSAMRHLAGHVCLITTCGSDGARNGLTATAVCSVSAEPPTLLCSVFTQTDCRATIQASGSFAVNVLSVADKALADRFASKLRGEERFQAGEWQTLETGSPVLKSALASFDCKLVNSVQVNTHSILIGEIHAVRITQNVEKPLLYSHGGYGEFSRRTPGADTSMQWCPDWDFSADASAGELGD
ncbi:MAG: flavin reductase family protein [Gammaproteobacteria bacterium]|nr:flavin reductase family protein [Gammaproteobacteria bacterium]